MAWKNLISYLEGNPQPPGMTQMKIYYKMFAEISCAFKQEKCTGRYGELGMDTMKQIFGCSEEKACSDWLRIRKLMRFCYSYYLKAGQRTQPLPVLRQIYHT
jgi:hypothetical protein